MRAWLGHYGGSKKQWFILFAATKDEAVRFVNTEPAELDYDIVRPTRYPETLGFFVQPVPNE